VLLALYADLGQVIRDSLRAHVPAALDTADPMDHSGLVEAIRARDAERAAAEATAHTAAMKRESAGR